MFGKFNLVFILIINTIDLPFKHTNLICLIVNVIQRYSTNDFALWIHGDLLHTDDNILMMKKLPRG